jgi:predicted Zn-dependent protease
MKFVPKEPPEFKHSTVHLCNDENISTGLEPNGNVNVTPGHPLKDVLRMLAIILGVLVLIYILLGFAVDLVAPHISPEMEKSLGRLFQSQFIAQKMPQKSKQLQTLLNNFLPALTPDDRRLEYQVNVIRDDTVNAVALPGGMVVVFSGLLDKMDSNEEVAFVLAHELGHFHHRHHLRSLGRSLLTMIFSIAVLGENSSATQFIAASFYQMQMKYSRNQEKAADLFALNLLKKCYGSVDGALKFMEKQVLREKSSLAFYYFSSHPHPQQRLEYIRKAFKDDL